MLKSKTVKLTVLLALFVLISGTNLSCGRMFPFKFTAPISLGVYDLEQFQFFSELLAGAPIPEDYEGPGLPVCDLPTQDDIKEIVRQNLGEWVANLITLDEMNLVETKLEALQGNFATITHVALKWRPEPVDDVEQPFVNLGTDDAPSGFGTDIVLAPEEQVDFLELIDEAAANPSTECASLNMDVSGTVPADLPVWEVTVTVEIVGHVQL